MKNTQSIIELIMSVKGSILGPIKYEVLAENKVGIICENLPAVTAFFERSGFEILSISEYKKRMPLSLTTASFAIEGNLF